MVVVRIHPQPHLKTCYQVAKTQTNGGNWRIEKEEENYPRPRFFDEMQLDDDEQFKRDVIKNSLRLEAQEDEHREPEQWL